MKTPRAPVSDLVKVNQKALSVSYQFSVCSKSFPFCAGERLSRLRMRSWDRASQGAFRKERDSWGQKGSEERGGLGTVGTHSLVAGLEGPLHPGYGLFGPSTLTYHRGSKKTREAERSRFTILRSLASGGDSPT